MIAIVGVHQKLGLVNCLRSFGASGLRLPLGIHVESLKSQLLKTTQKKVVLPHDSKMQHGLSAQCSTN